MAARLGGAGHTEAWREALRGEAPRELARTIVDGARGQKPLRLSVAIAGGSGVVKRGHPERWRLSGHGRWRAMHLGALEAAYSSAPFFPHLFPELRDILLSAPDGSSFSILTARLADACLRLIDAETLIPELRKLREADPERFRILAEEKSRGTYAEKAFADVIFRKGAESIFALLPAIPHGVE